MPSKTIEQRKIETMARASTATLVESVRTIEKVAKPAQHERMVRAWLCDELERRAGKITLDEEPEFERVYDETGDYLEALFALRPQLREEL